MMTILRFIFYLLAPLFAPLLILPLLVVWLLLSIVIWIWSQWLRATGKPWEFDL
jgi:hypothetical protein